MNSNIKKASLVSGVLLLVAVALYLNFQVYKPKIISELREVRGAYSKNITSLPYPDGYKDLGVDKTDGGRQINFRVKQSPEYIQSFYKNILTSDNWQIESEGSVGIFANTKYKKEGNFITITTSQQKGAEYTIVGIDIKKKN